MKQIYSAVMARLKEKVPALKWIDWDTAQLETQEERPAVRFPCALISIGITSARDIVDTSQYCEASVGVRLAFDAMERTNSEVAQDIREKALQPYDVVSDVYAALQGFETENFHSLSRVSQAKEKSLKGLFIYRITFKTDFEDNTAE